VHLVGYIAPENDTRIDPLVKSLKKKSSLEVDEGIAREERWVPIFQCALDEKSDLDAAVAGCQAAFRTACDCLRALE
jgi:hypothetical protein